MSQDEYKTITVQVSKKCWKKLKIMSIDKEQSLPQVASDILEGLGKRKDTHVEDSI